MPSGRVLKGEIPHGAARVVCRQRWQARLSQECELIIEEIKDHQFSSAGLPCEALHSCPLLKEEQTTARRLNKSANDPNSDMATCVVVPAITRQRCYLLSILPENPAPFRRGAPRNLFRRFNLAESAAVPPVSGTAEFTRLTACCPWQALASAPGSSAFR